MTAHCTDGDIIAGKVNVAAEVSSVVCDSSPRSVTVNFEPFEDIETGTEITVKLEMEI